MAAADETLHALNEVNGQKKPEGIGVGEWIWGALQGDFNPERSGGQIGFDMVVSLIPIVDTLCDLRDLCANIRQFRKDPSDKLTIFFIATTVIGFFPEVGTVVKSVLRLVWVYLKPMFKLPGDILDAAKLERAINRACDAALPKITEYLQHSRVVQWATRSKLPDVYKFVSNSIREQADKIDPEKLKKALDGKLDELTTLLKKIKPIVPSLIRKRVGDRLKFIDEKRGVLRDEIQQFAPSLRVMLTVIAKKLDDHAWKVQTYRTNRGWIAPISEIGSAKLINAKPPKWAKRMPKKMTNPPLKPDDKNINRLMSACPEHPKLSGSIIETFSSSRGGIRPDTIVGPAKLYRIVDPSNEGAGVFWVSEVEFKALKDRDEWREKFAVRPEWNQNGWVVEYEVKAGESLPVWRGPAAGQKLDGTDYHLEGGGEQIVFFPSSRDKMANVMPRVDRSTGGVMLDNQGNVDKRVEYTDVTGEAVPIRLRAEITDPHIKDPIETGWGSSDYSQEDAKRILLTVPT